MHDIRNALTIIGGLVDILPDNKYNGILKSQINRISSAITKCDDVRKDCGNCNNSIKLGEIKT